MGASPRKLPLYLRSGSSADTIESLSSIVRSFYSL